MPYGGPRLNTRSVNIAKLFCYVDESGQHTATNSDRSHIFVVATAIFEGALRDEAEQVCLMYEHKSGKKKRKWSACERENKVAFVRMIIDDDRFKRSAFVSVMRIVGQYDYDVRTILSIAKAVRMYQLTEDYTIDIYIDGISKTKQVEYARELRKPRHGPAPRTGREAPEGHKWP